MIPTQADYQKTFDKVARHLLTQKRKAAIPSSYDPKNPSCRYRTETGDTCAIGCLIPDDLYQTDMEGLNAETLIEQYPSLTNVPEIDHLKRDFFLGLQRIHDRADVEFWKDNLFSFAESYNLSTDVLKEFE